jgi:hypothetical protein
MKATTCRHIWVIYFVGFDDTTDTEESRVEPYVGKQRVKTSTDPQVAWHDVRLEVLARGGHLLTIVGDDENEAEAVRSAAEAEVMRRR